MVQATCLFYRSVKHPTEQPSATLLKPGHQGHLQAILLLKPSLYFHQSQLPAISRGNPRGRGDLGLEGAILQVPAPSFKVPSCTASWLDPEGVRRNFFLYAGLTWEWREPFCRFLYIIVFRKTRKGAKVSKRV